MERHKRPQHNELARAAPELVGLSEYPGRLDTDLRHNGGLSRTTEAWTGGPDADRLGGNFPEG